MKNPPKLLESQELRLAAHLIREEGWNDSATSDGSLCLLQALGRVRGVPWESDGLAPPELVDLCRNRLIAIRDRGARNIREIILCKNLELSYLSDTSWVYLYNDYVCNGREHAALLLERVADDVEERERRG